jgi:hypothetical protein
VNVAREGLEYFQVFLKGPGIVFEVIWIVELRGIYKNTDQDGVVFRAGAPHQFQMTLMQSTHGWNQAHFIPVL